MRNNGQPVKEPFNEQIQLEVLTLSKHDDDPEYLAGVAALATKAVAELLSFEAEAMRNVCPNDD